MFDRIQGAIDAASPGDVVEVPPGTYRETLEVTKDLTLRSTDGASVTIVDAHWGSAALAVSNGAVVTAQCFTFRNGASGGTGGNVRCEESTLDLRDSVIEDGDASTGGGLAMIRCQGAVQGNTFRGNTAGSGGGLYASGAVALYDNVFEDNEADKGGGGAYLRSSEGELRGNTFTDNRAGDDGGGVYVLEGSPWVDLNTFEDNVSDGEGGGLRVKLSTAVITGNLFVRNVADEDGGASRISHEAVVMAANTFLENEAGDEGGAVLLYESASVVTGETYSDNVARSGGGLAIINGWGDVELDDCVFLGNSADDGGNVYIDLEGRTTRFRRSQVVGGEAEHGGGIFAEQTGLVLENTLLASNVADRSGGALHLDGVTGGMTNSVAIWNEAGDGSALRISDGQRDFAIVNSVFAENVDGAAIQVTDGADPAFQYNDFDANDSNFDGVANPIGQDGNLAEPAQFADGAGGDWTLAPTSALRDAGDPDLLDVDGTRSDIGLLGGPGA